MALLVAYAPMTKKELAESVEDTIRDVKNWFEKNPQRRVCRAELWYGKYVSLQRKTFEAQIRQQAANTKTQD